MKAILIAAALALTTLSTTTAEAYESSGVYICVSSGSYAYHSTKNCSAVRHCNHEVRTVSKSDAINKYGRRACKKCY